MYSGSDVSDYHLHTDQRGFLVASTHGRSIVFHLPAGTLNVFASPERVNWRYKLGTGYRHEVLSDQQGRMETQFVNEQREVAAFFNLEAPLTAGRLLLHLPFQCGLPGVPAQPPTETAVRRLVRRSRRRDGERLRAIERAFPLPRELPFRDAILARIVGLTKFG